MKLAGKVRNRGLYTGIRTFVFRSETDENLKLIDASKWENTRDIRGKIPTVGNTKSGKVS